MKKRKKSSFDLTEIWSIIIICAGGFLFLSLLSYCPNDVSYYLTPPNSPTHNLMGPVGAWVSFILLFVTGFSAYLIPVFCIIWGILKLRKLPFKKRPDIYIFALCLAVISLCGLLSLLSEELNAAKNIKLLSPGGLIGIIVSDHLLIKYFGTTGTGLVMGGIFVVSLIYLTEIRLWLLLKWFGDLSIKCLKGIWLFLKASAIWLFLSIKRLISRIDHLRVRSKSPPEIKPGPANIPKKIRPVILKPPVAETPPITGFQEKIKKSFAPAAPAKIPAGGGSPTKYTLPSVDILEPPPAGGHQDSNEDLTRNARTMEAALKEFGITVEVVGIQRGPIVTLYELSLAPGTKIGKITALYNDIALAMRRGKVRIIAPLPGKAAVGIEVPNTQPRFVYLREVVSTPEFQDRKHKIPLALGMDVSGNPLISDLSSMPHLLVAGTTGSGKTVCLNTIILSILFSLKPDEVRFLMIDPKMVELSVYKHLPHLLVPVVHDPKKASLALVWVVREMERRYELFARVGVRNINGYNTRPEAEKQENILPQLDEGLLEIDYQKNPPAKLPYIVIVIDELADLMMVASADVETSIARLAQLSRAVGIHIILATQRPSVDVLTGIIKANFSTRISFQVASKIDSRTVLDASGGELLLGKGDMMFMPPGSSRLIRAQCTLVRDQEIQQVVKYIVAQKKANFISSSAKEIVFEKLEKIKQSADEDPLFNDALNIILAVQQASVSMLQRKLKIGYNRAARIVDMMEEKGIIAPLENGKREILVNRNQLITE